MRRNLIPLLKILRKSYEWRAERYKEDATSWRKQGQERLYCFYCGRAEECKAMMREIDELMISI